MIHVTLYKIKFRFLGQNKDRLHEWKISGSVVTESVGHFVDAEGSEIWICPQCNKPDDGSPMIGCYAGCKDYNNHSWIHNQS